ncbi:MAG: dienelactone hydrolase family protein [Stellaceae bacterium]
MAHYDRIAVDGRPMRVYIGEPGGTGPHPAILLAFHREGFSAFTEDVVAQFSSAGYLIAVPDQFHRCGDAPWQEAVKHRRDDNVLADMAAGLDYLKGRSDVDRDRIAIVGHCMGGRVAFLVASMMPTAFKACLSYYSGGMFKPWGDFPSPFERLTGIRCPVAGFFGNDDDNPPPAEVDRIEVALARAGVPHEFHRYDGTGHGYMYKGTSNYRAASALDSWRQSFVFLAAQRLAPPSPAGTSATK